MVEQGASDTSVLVSKVNHHRDLFERSQGNKLAQAQCSDGLCWQPGDVRPVNLLIHCELAQIFTGEPVVLEPLKNLGRLCGVQPGRCAELSSEIISVLQNDILGTAQGRHVDGEPSLIHTQVEVEDRLVDLSIESAECIVYFPLHLHVLGAVVEQSLEVLGVFMRLSKFRDAKFADERSTTFVFLLLQPKVSSTPLKRSGDDGTSGKRRSAAHPPGVQRLQPQVRCQHSVPNH